MRAFKLKNKDIEKHDVCENIEQHFHCYNLIIDFSNTVGGYIYTVAAYVVRNFSQSFAIFQYQFEDILSKIELLMTSLNFKV